MESAFSALRRVFRTTLLIIISLIAGLFLYVILVELMKSQFGPFPGFSPGFNLLALRYAFYGAAIGAVVLVRVSAKAMTKPAPGDDVLQFGQRLSRAAIITAALAELPAALGLVLFLLSGATGDFYLLLLASLFLEFMYFPRFSVWRDLVKKSFPQEGV